MEMEALQSLEEKIQQEKPEYNRAPANDNDDGKQQRAQSKEMKRV